MSAGTEAFISTVAAAVAAVAAAAALIVAVIALIVARRTLQETRTTTEAQRETLKATEAVVAGTGKLVSRVEESTLALHLILTESQAARGVELYREIARQVFAVSHAMQAVRDHAGVGTSCTMTSCCSLPCCPASRMKIRPGAVNLRARARILGPMTGRRA